MDELPDAFEQFDKLMQKYSLTKWQKIRCFIIYGIPLWFITNWHRLRNKIRR